MHACFVEMEIRGCYFTTVPCFLSFNVCMFMSIHLNYINTYKACMLNVCTFYRPLTKELFGLGAAP